MASHNVVLTDTEDDIIGGYAIADHHLLLNLLLAILTQSLTINHCQKRFQSTELVPYLDRETIPTKLRSLLITAVTQFITYHTSCEQEH